MKRTKRRMKRRTKRGGKPFSAYVPTWMRYPWRKTVSAPSKPPAVAESIQKEPTNFERIKRDLIAQVNMDQLYSCINYLPLQRDIIAIEKLIDLLENHPEQLTGFRLPVGYINKLNLIHQILKKQLKLCTPRISDDDKTKINQSVFKLRNTLRECDKTKKCEPVNEDES